MTDLKIRQARLDDVLRILELRHKAADWLETLGSDQWSDAGIGDTEFVRRVQMSIEHGETWVAEIDHKVIGTIAVDHWSDPGLWSPDELSESMIIHRMIIDREYAGRGIGKDLLDQAESVAAKQGAKWLRLDAWTTNGGLHAYYEKAGFRYVRTGPKTLPSAVLFERPVNRQADELPPDTPPQVHRPTGTDRQAETR